MRKTLGEMTLEELWQLFPIFLTEHKREWQGWYTEEEQRLREELGKAAYNQMGSAIDQSIRISHIGSTTLSSIWAKPIIDILIEISQDTDWESIKHCIEFCGYHCMNESDNRASFCRGYTIDGFAERVFHVHLRRFGDHNELYFRDYLMEHPEVAKEYEGLKLKLWKKYEHNRDAYTESKTELISKYTELAKIKYQGRYDVIQ